MVWIRMVLHVRRAGLERYIFFQLVNRTVGMNMKVRVGPNAMLSEDSMWWATSRIHRE